MVRGERGQKNSTADPAGHRLHAAIAGYLICTVKQNAALRLGAGPRGMTAPGVTAERFGLSCARRAPKGSAVGLTWGSQMGSVVGGAAHFPLTCFSSGDRLWMWRFLGGGLTPEPDAIPSGGPPRPVINGRRWSSRAASPVVVQRVGTRSGAARRRSLRTWQRFLRWCRRVERVGREPSTTSAH